MISIYYIYMEISLHGAPQNHPSYDHEVVLQCITTYGNFGIPRDLRNTISSCIHWIGVLYTIGFTRFLP
jgi:hypothetical protein